MGRRGGKPGVICVGSQQNRRRRALTFQHTDRSPSSHGSKPSASRTACLKSTPMDVLNNDAQRRLQSINGASAEYRGLLTVSLRKCAWPNTQGSGAHP